MINEKVITEIDLRCNDKKVEFKEITKLLNWANENIGGNWTMYDAGLRHYSYTENN